MIFTRIPRKIHPRIISKRFVTAVAERTLLEKGKSGYSVSVVFVDDACIRALNKKYFHTSSTTDVISFRLSESCDPDNFLGEVIICFSEVMRNARYFRNTFRAEYALCIVHGILHLLGYCDKPASARQIMRKEEEKLLDLLRKEQSLKLPGKII